MKLVAEKGSITGPALKLFPEMEAHLLERLKKLEEYDFGFLLLGLSPRRLLTEGRLFDNEQVLPLLFWFGQWDKHCRYWVSELMRQWTVFNPSEGDYESPPEEQVVAFRDYFQKKYAIPLIEEFREFVALCMLYPKECNAPSGPVDMVWHTFILHTEDYEVFSQKVWLEGLHMPPEILDEPEHSFATN